MSITFIFIAIAVIVSIWYGITLVESFITMNEHLKKVKDEEDEL